MITRTTQNLTKLIDVIKERMVVVEDDLTCSGGEQTKVYLDIPGILGDQKTLRLGVQVFFEHLFEHGLINQLTAVGGPTTGAIPLVMGLTMRMSWDLGDDFKWFIVRDAPKTHGLGRQFVGAQPGPGDKVILTDDVVSSGRSLMETVGIVQATGAQVLAVVPLVDRGNAGIRHFEKIGIPYLPVLTYVDLGLAPLGVK